MINRSTVVSTSFSPLWIKFGKGRTSYSPYKLSICWSIPRSWNRLFYGRRQISGTGYIKYFSNFGYTIKLCLLELIGIMRIRAHFLLISLTSQRSCKCQFIYLFFFLKLERLWVLWGKVWYSRDTESWQVCLNLNFSSFRWH